jgi:hypothetical protein
MASTVTIQNTLSWELPFLEQQPQLINGLEPALSSAQLVLDTILGPPFAWPWNRGITSFTTANQDYTINGLTHFGFLEGGSVTATATGGKPMAVAVKHFLELDANSARPTHASPYIDDGAGNITFRLMPGRRSPTTRITSVSGDTWRSCRSSATMPDSTSTTRNL